MFEITVSTKGESDNLVRCMGNRCGIGKSRDNLVQLRGWKVAGLHAQIEEKGDGLHISDQVDAGTFVNGKRIDAYGPLTTADVITIGAYNLRCKQLDVGNTMMAANEDGAEESAVVAEGGVAAAPAMGAVGGAQQEQLILWQSHVHEELLKRMDLKRIDVGTMSDDDLRNRIKALIDEVLDGLEGSLPPFITRARLTEDV